MFSQRRSHYWSQQSRTFFFKGFSAKQQKKPKKAANYSVIEQNALSDKHPKMTSQTRVWPVKPTIRPDIARFPAIILSPATRILSSLYIESMCFHEPHIILSTNKLLLIINYIKLVKKQTMKSIILIVTTLRSDLYLRSQTLPSKWIHS